MGAQPPSKLTVRFRVNKIPGSPGLRICSYNPWGLWAAARSPLAAQFYFERYAQVLAARSGLLSSPGLGGQVILAEVVDWVAAIAAGKGSLLLRGIELGEGIQMGNPYKYETQVDVLRPQPYTESRGGRTLLVVPDPDERGDSGLWSMVAHYLADFPTTPSPKLFAVEEDK